MAHAVCTSTTVPRKGFAPRIITECGKVQLSNTRAPGPGYLYVCVCLYVMSKNLKKNEKVENLEMQV